MKLKLKRYEDPVAPRGRWTGGVGVNWLNIPKFKKRKVKRTVYFTNHPKILKRLELFARDHKITLSATILGFCALGLMYEEPGKYQAEWKRDRGRRI